MSFASLVFFTFLPVVFALHYLRRENGWQNGVLLVASYVFYGWWDYRFCGLMLAASLLDYWTGARIAASTNPKTRKGFLILSLAGNLGLLGFFKYFNFFADSLALLLAGAGLDVNTSTLNIILPVGISFYTFQTLSYTIDIYRGQFAPRRNLIEYLTFVSFFPQLVAGPIERASHLLPQFSKARSFSHGVAVAGCRLMLWGLVKKMVVADNLGAVADAAFTQPASASPAQLAIGTVCFAFQIYGDFSGYSDIAAGVASLFGIQLQRNFAYPYFSQSVTEFWRRWHISLSTWFRDYVFIPLGGSRGTTAQTSATLFATFVLSGLWHGAAWHFVVWGALHGALLAGSKAWPRGRLNLPECPGGFGLVPTPGAALRMLRTFALVTLGWVFFRARDLSEALGICARVVLGLAGPEFYGDLIRQAQREALSLGLLAALIAVEWLGRTSWNPLAIDRWPQPARWALYTAMAWGLLLFGTKHPSEFIYFQF